jgi:hypothetical protein
MFIALEGKKINVKNITDQLSKIISTTFETKKSKFLSKPTLDVFIKGRFVGFVRVESGKMIFSTYSKYVEIKERNITSSTYEKAIKRTSKEFNQYFFYSNK